MTEKTSSGCVMCILSMALALHFLKAKGKPGPFSAADLGVLRSA